MAISDEIKQRLDIIDVVSGYVPSLRRAGRSYKATCPFHSERTPSFVVFPERQSWRCFGACATGGDLISFTMRAENLDFKDTLKLLANRAGISDFQPRQRQRNESQQRVNEASAAHFQGLLLAPQGMAARTYLQQRGVDADAIAKFEIGLSPAGGSALLQHLKSLGYSESHILKAGLASQRDDSQPRDLFNGRLMFPIRDGNGVLAGFGGRSLDGSEPKYLNSPRTELFDKGHILYAMHKARDAIKQTGEGVIVEGYMDVIAAHQHGFNNVVASMGTALTEQQVTLLRNTGRRFVLALDPDTAGQEATFRDLVDSWHIFEQRLVGRRRSIAIYERATDPFLVRVGILPPGQDPDQLIRSNPEGWQASLAEAKPLVDYLIDSARDHWDISTSEGKARAAEALYQVIASIGNPFEREGYLKRLAEVLGVQVATLEASLGKLSASSSRRSNPQQRPRASESPFESANKDVLQEHFLGFILQWPDLREHLADMDPQVVRGWEDRILFSSWLKCSTIDELRQMHDDYLQRRIDHLLSLPVPPLDLRQREQAVKDCRYHLEIRRLKSLKEEEKLALSEAGFSDDIEQRVVETNEQLKNLFQQKYPHHARP